MAKRRDRASLMQEAAAAAKPPARDEEFTGQYARAREGGAPANADAEDDKALKVRTTLYLDADLQDTLLKVAQARRNERRRRGEPAGYASVSALILDLIEEHRAALEREAGKG